MTSARGIYGTLRSSDGRIRVTTLFGVLALVVALAVLFGLPAGADPGPDSGSGVSPSQEDLGGQPNDCVAIGSLAPYELRIENPMDGVTYTGVDGSSFTVALYDGASGEMLDVTASGAIIHQIVVKGGSFSAVFDYAADPIGPQPGDTLLHAPQKNNGDLYNVSHVSICYEVASTCGDTLTLTESIWDAEFEVFALGNDEISCEDKLVTLSLDTDGNLNLAFFGSGTAAAFADITKFFTDPALFEPLEYQQGPGDLLPAPDGFEDVPWCALRAKIGLDGNEFDPYLDDDTMYPSLSGVTDPDSGDPSVACKVFVSENIEGIQQNILLIQGDPRMR